MIGFDGVRLTPLPHEEAGRGLFRTTSDIPVYIKIGRRQMLGLDVIRAGALTDGASVPRWLRAWFDPWGHGAEAYIWHDDLLRRDGVQKKVADLLFLYALISLGVPSFRAHLLYFAVRTRRPGKPITA